VPIFGGEGGPGAAVAGVEALLLQDLGIPGVDLRAARSEGGCQNDLEGDSLVGDMIN
jgi:hypothetical protein